MATRIADVIQTLRPGESNPDRDSVVNYVRRNSRFRSVILPTLEKAFPWLYDRPSTEDDFHAFCEREKIRVVTHADVSAGIYVVYAGEPFIFLNAKLRAMKLRHTMFHEVAHHLFHWPTHSRTGLICSKREMARKHIEAEVAAALLITVWKDVSSSSHNTSLR